VIAAILLAAGRGSRFGSQKLLARLPDGITVVETSIRNLVVAGCDVTVVTRDDADLLHALDTLDCRICINPAADEGMGHSLACGVAATADADGWLIALGDMPKIRAATIRAIMEHLRTPDGVVVPTYRDTPGHPVAFGARFRDQLIALRGDRGARALIDGDASAVTRLAVDDPGILFDIDRPADLA
jgi:molybdenum cofactor cytidylyltransferase